MSNELAVKKMANLRTFMQKLQPSIQAALPRHMTAERMVKIVQVAASRQPELLECGLDSLGAAVVTASQLGLEPVGPLGQAYIVAYWNSKTKKRDAQLIVGYKGLIELATRSGKITKIEAVVVYSNEEFKVVRGLHPDISHEQIIDGDAGEFRAVYAVATYTDGEKQFEVMNKFDIEKIRNRSRAGQSGPWVTDYEEMAKKTVIKRLCKLLPMSVELANAVEIDNARESGEPIQYIDMDVAETIEAAAIEVAPEEAPEPPKDKGDLIAEKLGA